jgi:hypothetical protein
LAWRRNAWNTGANAGRLTAAGAALVLLAVDQTTLPRQRDFRQPVRCGLNTL